MRKIISLRNIIIWLFALSCINILSYKLVGILDTFGIYAFIHIFVTALVICVIQGVMKQRTNKHLAIFGFLLMIYFCGTLLLMPFDLFYRFIATNVLSNIRMLDLYLSSLLNLKTKFLFVFLAYPASLIAWNRVKGKKKGAVGRV